MPDASKLTVNYFCLGALFVFVGSVLLCTLGFTVVLPFEAMRSWPQVLCTVLNSSYDGDVCSCDEQMSVFDTCVSKYPCLKIYVSYVIRASTTASGSASQSPPVYQNSSSPAPTSDDRHQDRRRRNAAAAAAAASLDHSSMQSTRSPSDIPRRELQRAKQLSSVNVSSLPVDVAALVSTASPVATRDISNRRHQSGTAHQASADDVTAGNGSEAMTSYRLARDTREAVTDYDFRDLTPTATADAGVNRSYVAKLYRSWDDSFLPECSLTECDDETWNIKQARRFNAKWGQVGQRFRCFYNPDRQNVVILERTSPFAAVNAVVWPCLLLLTGVSLWLGLCLGCWSLAGYDARYKEEYVSASLRLH